MFVILLEHGGFFFVIEKSIFSMYWHTEEKYVCVKMFILIFTIKPNNKFTFKFDGYKN